MTLNLHNAMLNIPTESQIRSQISFNQFKTMQSEVKENA